MSSKLEGEWMKSADGNRLFTHNLILLYPAIRAKSAINRNYNAGNEF